MKNIFNYICILALTLVMPGCEDMLDAPTPSEFAPENVLTNEKGIEALLFSAYHLQNPRTSGKNWVNIFETTTDITIVSEGAEEGNNAPFRDWTWDENTPWLANSVWEPLYRSIRDANTVVENINTFEGSAETKELFMAEARFVRASDYALLYNLFGPVVLRQGSGESSDMARATDEQMRTFIETELEAAATDLPHPANLPADYGYNRATKGTALGYLAKHYANTQQWEKVITTTQEIMDLQYYSLYPSFRELFFVSNEGNREILATFAMTNNPAGTFHNNYPNGVYSSDFYSATNVPELVRDKNIMSAWAANFRVQDWIVNAMAPEDDRLLPVVDDYMGYNGNVVVAKKYSDQRSNNRRYVKFFDPNAVSNFHGCDLPWIRYADIMLVRAEALNALNLSINEAKQLVMDVRERAGLTDHTALLAAAQGDALRDFILLERAKEFIHEGKRREDLLRHDLYVKNAQDRGVASAADFRAYFPIPASEANANRLIMQDEGY